MKTRVLISLLLITLASAPFGLCQDDKEVVSSGAANIVGGNTLGARQEALNQAFRAAVELGLGTLIEAQTFTGNYKLISDNIYAKSQGYVKSYEIINEGPGEAPNTYKVTIKAVVNLTDMGNDLRALGILQDIMGMPKIMSMIDEVSTSSGHSALSSDPSSSIAVEQKLLKRGFELVDKDVVSALRSQELARMRDDIKEQAAFMGQFMEDDAAVLRLAEEASRSYGAQYLLLGLAAIDPYPSAGAMKISTATFKAKIVDASTGEKIAAAQKSESGNGVSRAAADLNAGQRAGELMAEALIPQIIQNWSKRSQQGILYLVKVYGIEDYARQGLKFVTLLKTLPGVTNAVKRSWDAKLGRLEIDLTYRGGDSDALITGIFERAPEVPGFDNIQLDQAQGNNLVFRVK